MTKRLAFMLALALGACAGSGSGRVEYASAVTVRSPELITLDGSPDVYVLADADEPVFYTDNYYWLYRDNGWYRSHSYDRDWVRVRSPSPRLRQIRQPTAYVRYQTKTREARNAPATQREPWRDDQERTDVRNAPNDLAPHSQEPLQPTQPQQAPQPYPLPPQQQSPVERDQRIDTNQPVRDQLRNDVRVPDDGTYERAPGAPAQTRGAPGTTPGSVKDDMPQPPPGQVRKDDSSTKVAPGQVNRDVRRDERVDDKAMNAEDKADDKKADAKAKADDAKAKATDEKSDPDQKRDY